MKLPVMALALLTIAQLGFTQTTGELESRPVAANDTERLPIEEVLVTVSKRTESIQDISAAVSAFSGDTLKENNVQNYTSLADLTPNMQTRSEGAVTIRGIGRARNGASPVAFHVNGIFLGARGAPFYDLQSVEVLRGPAGTVFGRNATAGAINAKWQPPTGEFEFGGDARHDTLSNQLRAYLDSPLPLPFDAAVRFAAYSRDADGSLDNLLQPDDADPENAFETFVRMFFSADPLDNLHINLRAIRSRSLSESTNTVFSPSETTRRSGSLEELGAQPLPPDDLTKVRSTLAERIGQRPYSKFSRIDGDLTWSLEELPFIGAMDIDFVLAAERSRANNLYDLDGTEVPIIEGHEFPSGIKRSAELRFTSMGSTGLDWILGLFWFRENSYLDQFVDVRLQANASAAIPGFPPFLIGSAADPEIIASAKAEVLGSDRVSNSQAVFGNIKLDLATLFDLPQIEVIAGLRVNRDTDLIKQDLNRITVLDPASGEEVFDQSRTENGRYPGEYRATTGEFGAKWYYSDEGMLYFKFARGYKPGLTQPLGEEVNAVDPEFLDAFELGWKTSFFDQQLVTNITGFYYDYTDLQVFKIIPTGVRVDNAGAAELMGLEFELQWAPSANFYMQASVSWLHTEFQEFCGRDDELEDQSVQPGCTEQLPHNFAGEKLSDAPEYSAALLARYTITLGEWGTLTPMLKTSWVDDYQRREYGNPIDRIDAFSNTSVRMIWGSPTGRFRIEAFVEQLEDHDDIFFDQFSLPNPGQYSLISMNPRRSMGISLESHF